MKKSHSILTLFVITLLIFIMANYSLTYGSKKTNIYYLSVVPFHAPEKIVALYQPMVDYLNKHSKYKWQLRLFHTHEAIAQGLCNGETSIALLGPAMAAVANKQCKIKPVVMALGLEKKPTFKIAIVTSKKEIDKIQDLQNRTLGIFKPNTMARGVTKKMILDEGMPLSAIKLITYNRLEDIIKDVMAGVIDAGGIRESIYYNFKDANLKIIKLSEDQQGFAFFARHDLNNDVVKDFQKVMTILNVNTNPNTHKITNKWDLEVSNGFAIPYDGYLEDAIKNYNQIKDLYQ